MKIVKLLIVCLMIASCQIHYVRTVPPPEVIVVERPVYPPPAHPHPVHPKPVKPAPEKPHPQKDKEDNHKKRPDEPAVKRPERPQRSDGDKKAGYVYTK